TPFARVGPGHYRIQRRCLDPSLQDFSVACFLESFATTIRQFRIGSAWAHQTPCGKKRLDGLFVSSATCQPYSAALPWQPRLTHHHSQPDVSEAMAKQWLEVLRPA